MVRRFDMIEIYENIRDEKGGIVPGRTKLFIVDTNEFGDINLSEHGTKLTPEGTGTMFIVDDWLIPQLDKVRFKDGVLSVKDGEELIPPVKSEKEKQREELLRQLALLDADTEESTDESNNE